MSANRLEELHERIAEEVPFIGTKPYSHNIIATALREIFEDYGRDEMNQAIDGFGLTKHGWSKSTHGESEGRAR